MNISLLLTFQLIADAVLCAAIIFLFAMVNREIKKRGSGVPAGDLAQFKRLIAESQAAAENLIRAMEESRKILKDVAYTAEGKERQLRNLVAVTENRLLTAGSTDPGNTENAGDRYGTALDLVRQGLTEKEIAQRLGLTEGEVSLIIELDRRKNESA
jgi:CRP-like cAMP-binding protein